MHALFAVGLREFYAANLSNRNERSSHLFETQTAAVLSKPNELDTDYAYGLHVY